MNTDNVKLSTIAKEHVCAVNHQGSAGKMEADGAVACFKRSKAKHGVQYTKCLGDGDSEATGYVRKRMGKALMNAVTEHKLKKLIVDANGQQLKKNVANQSEVRNAIPA